MKKLIIILFILIMPLLTLAQDTTLMEQRRQQIYTYKVALITQRIHLTSDQAQNFWPVYNEYDKKKTETKQKLNKVRKNSFGNFTTTDDELLTAVNLYLDLLEDEIKLEKEYKDKFLKIINIRQLAELYRSEQEFRKLILERIKEKLGGDVD